MLAQMELAPGVVVREGIRLVRELASGAMGSVWVADHDGLGTQVAVKFVHESVGREDAVVVERFRREATAAARLRSPHVVQVFDAGVTADGAPFIVMELLRGESLRQRLERGPLSLRDARQVMAQVARALEKAHQMGIVHRDIKPDNIFLVAGDEQPFAKVLDFGIAKHTHWVATGDGKLTNPDSMLGTPAYMSRDVIMATRGVDHHVDLWAMAVCAYEMLTGWLPFDGASVGLICVAICKGQYQPVSARMPGLSPALDEFFARALHQQVDARYQSARELAFGLLLASGEDDADVLAAAFDQTGRLFLPGLPRDATGSGRGRDGLASQPLRPLPAPSAAEATSSSLVATAGDPSPGGWPRAAIGAVVASALLVLALVAVLATRPSGQSQAVVAPAPPAVTSATARPEPSEAPPAVTGSLSTVTSSASEVPPAPLPTASPARRPPRPAPTSTLSPEEQLGI